MKEKEIASLVENVIYKLKGITYVPHYKNKHLYVSPGYGRYHARLNTVEELKNAGAEEVKTMLWQRAEHTVQEFK